MRGLGPRVRGLLRLPWLSARNRLARASVTGSVDVVVSLTSYGRRLGWVHLAIESIGRGSSRPRRLVLWVSDRHFVDSPPRRIERLKRRGLEVRLAVDHGPHKKYYPYASTPPVELPLVTADDDVFYPSRWLGDLVDAAARDPGRMWCFRGRVMRTGEAGEVLPYRTWPLCMDVRPNVRLVPTGVGGIYYPLELLARLRERGTAFVDEAPFADDLWIHHTCLTAGIPISLVRAEMEHFPVVPHPFRSGLMRSNVRGGGNDDVVRRLYADASDRAMLATDGTEA